MRGKGEITERHAHQPDMGCVWSGRVNGDNRRPEDRWGRQVGERGREGQTDKTGRGRRGHTVGGGRGVEDKGVRERGSKGTKQA